VRVISQKQQLAGFEPPHVSIGKREGSRYSDGVMADDLSANLAALRIDRNKKTERAHKPRSYGWIIGVVVALSAAAGAAQAWPMVQAAIFKTEVQTTVIAEVSPAQASVELTASGYVDADRSSNIAPKVPGRVAAVYVRQGQTVKAGDVLVELDPADDRAAILAARGQVAAALAQVKGAEARVATAEAQLAEVQLQADRENKLAQAGVSASSVVDDLKARVTSLGQQVNAAKAEQQAASANVGALSAQVKVLETGLRNLTLVAPIDGTVVNQPPQIGEYLGPQPAGVSVDMGGIRIADFSTLLVETDIPEVRLAQVKVGGPTEIVLDAYPTRRLRGTVKEITPEVDRAKATVMVKVAFVDVAETVLPDMSARVSFLSEALDEAAMKEPPKTVVPGAAVTERGGAKVVFVLEGDRVRMVPVTLGPAFGSGFELKSGPRPGTQVIATPAVELKDGQKVKSSDSQ
jgi:RND family efflux transporter MFP subunit